MNCKDCLYWQDYSDRIYAMISNGHSDTARNRIELRHCRYVSPPSQVYDQVVWTDSDYVCGGWREVE